jgi:hypothetical protein
VEFAMINKRFTTFVIDEDDQKNNYVKIYQSWDKNVMVTPQEPKFVIDTKFVNNDPNFLPFYILFDPEN